MRRDEQDQDLSQITTIWNDVHKAHFGSEETIHAAQERMLNRYSTAIKRYLLGAVRDRDAADDLYQTFAERFLRGDFQRANPDRGRFRQFLKTALYHMIVDYQRQQRRRPVQLSAGVPEPEEDMRSTVESDERFLAI